MNLSEAIGHASTLFIPEFLFGMDEEMLEGERSVNEEALHLLIEEYFQNPNPSFDFDLVLDLADRNRSIAPLKIADDAYVIDTTSLTIKEVVGEMLVHIQINPL